eukprot:CAMPEP_0172501466 /NCGR_PEP_ID=MMETSP1066-20121228/150134_1 /TAXON_ID=671091 /ORGANISM="Coscinodiscus wailesii, Strain CCMP2513" /LENGTH=78 /DNA_ID=CAMNT_0013276257 /DNA_START=1090 /DNA_END=1326 /DNA_ORIENTATION=+
MGNVTKLTAPTQEKRKSININEEEYKQRDMIFCDNDRESNIPIYLDSDEAPSLIDNSDTTWLMTIAHPNKDKIHQYTH